jgi:hypothetical protein
VVVAGGVAGGVGAIVSDRSAPPRMPEVAPASWSRMPVRLSPAARMFIQAPTTMTIAKSRPSHAQNVRPTKSPPGLSSQRIRAKISTSTDSAAVIIDGVTPISSSMFASRIACQTSRTIASRPAIQPTPCHIVIPVSAPIASSSSFPGPV